MLNLAKIKHFLSGKKVTLVILMVAIFGRAIQLIYFFNIRVDRSFQVIASDNLLHGHGISTAQVFSSDLSSIIYQPLIKWPPAYSLILAPFYALFNHNYIAAGMTVDIVFAVIFILVSRSLLKILDVPVYLVNIYTLASGFFIYDFYLISTADALAITFFIIALYYTISFLKGRTSWPGATALICGFLFLCAATKYLLIPAVFVIPLFLVVKAISDRDAQMKKTGIFSLIALSVSLGLLLWYQKNISGSAAYISDSGRGFFPENLLAAYPYFPAAFINPDILAQVSGNHNSVRIVQFFQWIYILFLLIVLTSFIRVLYKNGFKKLSLNDIFFYLSFFASFAVVSLLVVLSLRIEKDEGFPGNFWTFIQEPRYYGLPVVLMQLLGFTFYRYYQDNASKIFKYLFYFFLLLLLPGIVRGIFFDIKRITRLNKEEYSWQYENRFQKYASQLIHEEQLKHPGENIVVGGWYYLSHRISLISHIPILYDVNSINDVASLNTKKPVVLFVFLHKNELPLYQRFLSIKEKEAVGYFNEYYFYKWYVSPH